MIYSSYFLTYRYEILLRRTCIRRESGLLRYYGGPLRYTQKPIRILMYFPVFTKNYVVLFTMVP